MSYTDLNNPSASEFKRLCGVSRDTFNKMIEVLRPQLGALWAAGGAKQTECRRPTTDRSGVLA